MIHEILPVGMLGCNCSVLGDEISREAIVIDPGDDVSEIVGILEPARIESEDDRGSPMRTSTISAARECCGGFWTGAPVYMA